MPTKDTAWVWRAYLKRSRSRSGHKSHYNIKVTNMLCDSCFPGYFANRYRLWQSFDHITSSNLTFSGGQVKVRLRSGQIFRSIYLHKRHTFLAKNFLSIQNISFPFLRCAELQKTASEKMTSSFSLICYKCLFMWSICFVCGNCLLILSIQKTV